MRRGRPPLHGESFAGRQQIRGVGLVECTLRTLGAVFGIGGRLHTLPSPMPFIAANALSKSAFEFQLIL